LAKKITLTIFSRKSLLTLVEK